MIRKILAHLCRSPSGRAPPSPNLHDIQRHLAEQVYYLDGLSGRACVSAWESYVRNFGPNLGNDYGGRLTEAWLERQA